MRQDTDLAEAGALEHATTRVPHVALFDWRRPVEPVSHEHRENE
jgi:hypothetical protein